MFWFKKSRGENPCSSKSSSLNTLGFRYSRQFLKVILHGVREGYRNRRKEIREVHMEVPAQPQDNSVHRR